MLLLLRGGEEGREGGGREGGEDAGGLCLSVRRSSI